jgi:hypothetical protein
MGKTDVGTLKVSAKHIVIATNTPVNDWVLKMQAGCGMRTHVIGYQILKDTYPENFCLGPWKTRIVFTCAW